MSRHSGAETKLAKLISMVQLISNKLATLSLGSVNVLQSIES